MTKQRGARLTQDHELIVISRMFDLVATLPADRRTSVIEYVQSRLVDMPVIAQVDPPKAADQTLFERSAAD